MKVHLLVPYSSTSLTMASSSCKRWIKIESSTYTLVPELPGGGLGLAPLASGRVTPIVIIFIIAFFLIVLFVFIFIFYLGLMLRLKHKWVNPCAIISCEGGVPIIRPPPYLSNLHCLAGKEAAWWPAAFLPHHCQGRLYLPTWWGAAPLCLASSLRPWLGPSSLKWRICGRYPQRSLHCARFLW
jgi:hypothetical protein